MTGNAWPVELSGVTESVVTTREPDGRWNVAALGLVADDDRLVTARTWGRTRTRRNFRDRAGHHVQFTRDPVDFVEAACGVREVADPVLDSADAWVRVDVEPTDEGETGGTGWVEWRLTPVESEVVRRVVPTMNRARSAVVEATVAASRLDVPTYDSDVLRERIAYFETVVDSCGGPRDREAWGRFEDLVDWRG